jgi:CRISPR system Cascade subunit CasE
MYFSRVRIRPNISQNTQLGRLLQDHSYSAHRLLWDLFSDNTQRQFIYREEIAREQIGPAPTIRGEPIYYLVSHQEPTESALFKVEPKPYDPQLVVGQRLNFECRVNPVIARQKQNHKQEQKHDLVMDTQVQFLSSFVNAQQLQAQLTATPKKKDYKNLLLANFTEQLDQQLTDILANDKRYFERLAYLSNSTDKLEWAIKAQIDQKLELWWQKQGERCGFKPVYDANGLSKLQNSSYNWHPLVEKSTRKDDKAGFNSIDLTGELEVTDTALFKNILFNGLGRSKAFGCGLLLIKHP